MSGSIKIPDSAKYYKYFEENLFKAIRESAAEAAIQASAIVPIWSGMAKGSFLAKVKVYRMSRSYISSAAAIFGLVDSPQSIDISSHIKEYRTVTRKRKNGTTYSTTRKIVHYLGSGEIKNASAGANRSTYRIETTPKGYKFSFESRVFHYDDEEVSNSWPSESFDIFKTLFKDSMDSRKNEIIPNKAKYFITINVKDLKGKRLPYLKYTQARVERPPAIKSTSADISRKYRARIKSTRKLVAWYRSLVREAAKKPGNDRVQMILNSAIKTLAPLQNSKSKKIQKMLKEVDFQIRL